MGKILESRYGIPPIDVIYARTGSYIDIKLGISRAISDAIGDDPRVMSSKKSPFGMSPRSSRIDIDKDDPYGKKRIKASEFDAYMSYVMTAWYCPSGGTVLDPFAGGPIRAVTSDMVGASYYGIDISSEQIDFDRRLADICDVPATFVCGDSSEEASYGDIAANFMITCPPYYDVERYGGGDRDLSMMSHDCFEEAYARCLERAVGHLCRPSFAVIVVGDARDKDGSIRCLDHVTIDIMRDLGAMLYNRCVLIPCIGSASLRCVKPFDRAGKITRGHQNILVFYLSDGDMKPEEFWRHIHPDGTSITPPLDAFRQSHVGLYIDRINGGGDDDGAAR